MRLQIREDQINALTQFLTVNGVYANYKTGVLKKYYEKEFDPECPDIKRYIAIYEDYLDSVLKNSLEEIYGCLSLLKEIELQYQPDIIIRLRRAICERYFGFLRADELREDGLKNLE